MQQRVRTKRLPPEIFDLPVEKMREGYYTDAYFNHTREVLIRDDRHPRVVMQVFQRRHSYLGGIDEAIAVLKLCAEDWDDLTVHALYDGDAIEPFEPVLRIEGDYTGFAHLETVYLGVLARRTLITSNVVRVLEAANGKPIIFMPARHDHHRVQTGDGYAAFVGGQVVGAEVGVTSEAQASWWGGRGIGTVPHALIAAYGGNTVLAATKFVENVDSEMNVTVLSTSRTTRCKRRSKWPGLSARASGACGSTPRASSSTARSGARWATSTRAASTSGWCARCATRSTATASSE